jgi:UDP:flavonoid glycosyltransferase YjiC (YdhE family)
MGLKILVLVWPEVSAYHAALRLSRTLAERGNQVIYAVPAQWQDFIHRQGFETVVLEDVQGRALWQTSTGWLKTLTTSRRTALQRLDELCAALAWIQSGGFNLVLLEVTLWHFAPLLRRLGIPYLAVNACLGGAENAEIPPIFSFLPPANPRLGLPTRLAWLRLRYFGAFNHRYHGVLPSHPKERGWRACLADAGAAARHFFRTVAEPLRMPVYYQLLRLTRQAGARIGWGDYGYRLVETELVFGPQAVDFPRQNPPPSRRYAGASVDVQRGEDAFDWSQLAPRLPLVYCAIGSHGGYWNQANRRRLVQAVVEAARSNPQWQFLLQAPAAEDLASLQPLPHNILAAAWFPQLQALQRADLIVCHGGFGTLREALFYGVPLIIFPLGVDQPGNAARVVYHRLGLAGDIRTVTAQQIGAMIETVMNDPSFRQNAVKMSQALQADNDCAETVAFLESLAD